MIIGITGIFASGKSTVCKILAKHGYKIINADKVGHDLYKKKSVKDKVVKVFGKEILTNNKIDRRKLKDIVFNNKSKLKKLNSIMHPLIIKEINSSIKKSKNKKIVVDAAVLIEANWHKKLDKVIVVKSNKELATKRALKKGKYTKKDINTIFASQLPQTKKLKYADYVLDNRGSLARLEKNTKKIIDELR